MAEWERRERRELVIAGPSEADAVELMAQVNSALSDYWLLAGAKPHSEVPPGVVVVSAAGGVLTIQIEHAEPAGGQPVGARATEEGDRDAG